MTNDTLRLGSLFSGIGGMDLGLERAGLEVDWFVENNPYAKRVLSRHWPGVRQWDDVRTFPPDPVDDWKVDVLAGGFPCVDISTIGLSRGIDGERSGLWADFARCIRKLEPEYVIVENVTTLLAARGGMDRVLGDLASLGFDAEWTSLSPAHFGIRQNRWRVFIVAWRNQAGSVADVDRSERGQSHEWTILHQPIDPVPFAGDQPIPGGVRIDHGPSDRVDVGRRIAGCANAVVPQVAEWIGRNLVAAHLERLNVTTCSLCDVRFDPESEGGIRGEIGIMPVAFCPVCRNGLWDMHEQHRLPVCCGKCDWCEDDEW
tara:strand:- start:8470 stop:9417 length:948 start_codon:yes stop_codon:yes gene_type:complete